MSNDLLNDVNIKKYKTKVQQMQQVPLEDITSASALDDLLIDNIDYNLTDAEKHGVNLIEVKTIGHMILRGDGADADFAKVVQEVLGVSLPGRLENVYSSKTGISWISPDEWLVQMPTVQIYNAESRLREQLNGHISIVNNSGGYVVLQLSGDKVLDLLKKCTPYNVEEENFPVGKVVSTIFAKTQAVIVRKNKQKWEIIIRRSFAEYVFSWLIDGGKEYGIKVNS